MKGFAVYTDHGQYDGGYEFQQVFLTRSHAEAAVTGGLGTEIEEIEIYDRPLEFKIRYSMRGTWKRGLPTKGIPLSGDLFWEPTTNEFVYWETFSGYDNIPTVKVTKTGITGVHVWGVDKQAVSAAYLVEVHRWQQNRAQLVDLGKRQETTT